MKKFLIFLATIIACLAAGFLIGRVLGRFFGGSISEGAGLGEILTVYITMLAALIVGYYLHVILHELGHMAMGLVSGYSFVSFRIFNIIFIKEEGKLVRKKFNIVGTGGQCLMSPPELEDGTYPFVLFNLGGSLMNFLLSAVCLGGFFLFSTLSDPSLVASVLLTIAVIGAVLGLLNIIPLKISGIANDGYNAMTLGKNKIARQAFWLQLRVNAMVTHGARYRDLPEEWFTSIDSDDWNDPIVAALVIMKYNYLMDKMELAESRALAESLLKTTGKMLDVHKNELRCDLLFHELIGERRKEEIDRLYTKNLKKYIKATSSYMSRQRLLYTYARLFLNDSLKAEKARESFDRACSHTPFLGEIAGEKDLIELVDDIAIRAE